MGEYNFIKDDGVLSSLDIELAPVPDYWPKLSYESPSEIDINSDISSIVSSTLKESRQFETERILKLFG